VKIERNGQILTIKETPGCLWIFGLFFALIGSMFVYGALGGYSNYEQATRWIIAAHLFAGLCAVGAGYWIIYKAPITRITIDRGTETLTYRKKGLSGRSDRVFRFRDIERFLVLEDRDSDGDPVFALGFELTDGEVISISAIQTPDESFKRDLVFRANEFIYKQMPSYRTAAELEDET
jgi:hypothetical protein